MARIRTIKPEFPQSESMGRVSRDARLLFVNLWTLCDDSGKTRAASRMLASLLYPYDDDARDLIDSWLEELEHEGCVARYVVDGATYLQVINWSDHQKIDKPSKSKYPTFDESSRILSKPLDIPSTIVANPREASSGDQGREGKGNGEDLNPPTPLHEKPAKAPDLHASLPLDAWAEWLAWRRKKRWPCDATTLTKQLNALAKYPTETQRQMIDASINSGWQGIFAPKGGAQLSLTPRRAARSADEIEADERARGIAQ